MIVSLESIQQKAERAAQAGECAHKACPYPENSEAAAAFHAAYSAARTAQEGGAA